ncbi:hypothetical protein [Streptomyces sp. CRN 30]|uniref:hypothetical protein n=1 Tax=Streptomyces sp. CRN 30 TaxID=3075613 RepID=UPI002A8314BD|nr:hypothetical protein [Streptomyces sp. CRN 30]
MHSESVMENHAVAPVRGRRRKRGGNAGRAAGPVFVDTSGRRARVLRRIGMLVGAVCLGYAVVLGLAFMGWGISSTPAQLLPFGDGGAPPPGGTPPSGAPVTPERSPS